MRKFSAFLCAAIMLLGLVSCGQKVVKPEAQVFADGAVIKIKEKDVTKTFTVEIVDAEGTVTTVTVKTDLKTVGEPLQRSGLLLGEQGEFGLYIKVVNGITADYETDGTYWAFYVNGEYAAAGVDMTESVDGAVYRFCVETM